MNKQFIFLKREVSGVGRGNMIRRKEAEREERDVRGREGKGS